MSRLEFHEPVLVDPVLSYLIGNPAGVYLDGTLGGGGHSLEILKRLTTNGRLIGIDFDEQALEFARNKLKAFENQVVLRQGNFAEVGLIIRSLELYPVDGILLDLGVSSHQIDTGERGFSYSTAGPLDMRMGSGTGITAQEIINSYSERELEQIFREFGEERHAHRIARAILKASQEKPVTNTEQLASIIKSVIPFQHRIKTLARIFQAIRIAVNTELENLRAFLDRSLDVLKPGARLVIIAYHSLEDRMVKEFFVEQANPCQCPPDFPICVCGKKATMRILTKKVVRASEQEIKTNPRSRSAKLRAAEKI